MYDEDVLPLWVAEMDYPLAPTIAATLVELVANSDTGYSARSKALGLAFADYAEATWGWRPDAARVAPVTDVSTGIVEIVRCAASGGRVVITSPVYPPFFSTIAEGGAEVIDVPLICEAASKWSLDIPGIAATLQSGARAILLCHPHNPLGIVHTAEQLAEVADLAAKYDAIVISDEVHAPLTHSDESFTPFLAVSKTAADVGVCLSAASKAWNVAGLKAAFFVTDADSRAAARLAPMPPSVPFRVSHFGVQAAITAFRDSRAWLERAVAAIESNRRLLRQLVEQLLPEAVLHEARAGYLAWIDLRQLGWGDDPARRILEEARVALNSGSTFGAGGAGHVRINFACSPEVLEDAIQRIAALQ